MNLRRGILSAICVSAMVGARAESPMVSITIGPRPAASEARPETGLFRLEPPPVQYAPATAMERALEDRLVRMEDGVARAVAPPQLAGVKFYALYFSAGWNASSRAFTAKLVDDYPKLRALYPEFEIVMVSRDQSRAAMVASMHIEQMPWPALRWDLNAGTREVIQYGRGVPCLVLVDAEGAVLADVYRDGAFVGSEAVLREIWKILYEYRRGHPAEKLKA